MATVSAISGGDVVLVTGASGFLGQHIVKLLQQKAPEVKEIRVLDIKPFTQALDYKALKPLTVHVGDVRSLDDVRDAVDGVDVVIHASAVIDVSPRPDMASMTSVNIEGTQNVLRACKEKKVKRLVHTSTCDVAVGCADVLETDETTPEPAKLLFPGYGSTKKHAEVAVLKAHSTSTNGELRTLALRAGALYGEGDEMIVSSALRSAAKNNGVLQRLSRTSDAKTHIMYAGNFAWAHVLASRKLAEDVTCGGQFYIITDDTPSEDFANFQLPFLQVRGFRLSEGQLPFTAIYMIAKLMESIAWVISPVYDLKLPLTSASLTYLETSHTYRRARAEEKLRYQPLYSPEEAMTNSLSYYKQIPLTTATPPQLLS